MKKGKGKYYVGALLVAMIALFGWYYVQPSELDAFAQCLAEEEATMYGAFWCSHCEEQKRAFGTAEKHLSYVECSTPDGRGSTGECTELGIRTYPTWEFADGSRVEGRLTVEQLAERTGCMLP